MTTATIFLSPPPPPPATATMHSRQSIAGGGAIELHVNPLPIGENITTQDLLAHKALRLERNEVGPFLRRMDSEELEFQKMEVDAYRLSNPVKYYGRVVALPLAMSALFAGVFGGALLIGFSPIAIGDPSSLISVAEAVGVGTAGAGVTGATVGGLISAVSGPGGLAQLSIEKNRDIQTFRIARLRDKVTKLHQRMRSSGPSEVEQAQLQMVHRIFANTIKDHTS